MKRRALLACAWLPLSVHGQSDWRRVAVPYVTHAAYLHALEARWYAPRAAEFRAAADQLIETLRGRCAGGGIEPARSAWRSAMQAWERLNAVAIGPLLERRSARRIDFVPTRPASIQRALVAAPSDLARVGAPAKGLPALEWLLWSDGATPGGLACSYAVRLAEDVAEEATALAKAFASARPRDEEAQAAAFAELMNQFVSGIEALRWAQIERPRREGRGRYPRATSQSSALAWAARWQALRNLAVAQPDGSDGPVSIEAYLRGRGLNPEADRLRLTVERSDSALQGMTPSRALALTAAARALDGLKRAFEDEIAPALEVLIGFSDADGD